MTESRPKATSAIEPAMMPAIRATTASALMTTIESHESNRARRASSA